LAIRHRAHCPLPLEDSRAIQFAGGVHRAQS
jgi:hypothetical protein